MSVFDNHTRTTALFCQPRCLLPHLSSFWQNKNDHGFCQPELGCTELITSAAVTFVPGYQASGTTSDHIPELQAFILHGSLRPAWCYSATHRALELRVWPCSQYNFPVDLDSGITETLVYKQQFYNTGTRQPMVLGKWEGKITWSLALCIHTERGAGAAKRQQGLCVLISPEKEKNSQWWPQMSCVSNKHKTQCGETWQSPILPFLLQQS